MAADYEVTLSLTDSMSFRFDVPLLNENDEPDNLTGKSFEYVLWGTCEVLRLSEGDGITVDTGTAIVSIAADPTYRLPAGTYMHGLRSTDADNITVQHFDGQVSVSKGGF